LSFLGLVYDNGGKRESGPCDPSSTFCPCLFKAELFEKKPSFSKVDERTKVWKHLHGHYLTQRFFVWLFLKGKDKVKESLSLLKSEIAILPTTSFCKRKDLSWVPTEFNLPPSSKWYGNVYFRKHGNGFLKTCLDTHKEFRTLKWSTIKKFIRICLQGYFPWMSKHNLKLFGAAIFFVSIQRLLRQNSNFCQLHFLHEIFLWQPVNAFLLYGKTDITSLLPYFQLCLGKGDVLQIFCLQKPVSSSAMID